MSAKKQQKLSEALNKLEKIVEELNNDSIDIESGLEKFKQGAELIGFCNSKLKKIENEFIELKQQLDQTFEDER